MTRIHFICLLVLTFAAPPALALDLYSGEVAVEDQSLAERQASVPNALLQVLQKHSGQRDLPVHPALDAALVNAGRNMVAFHYVRRERAQPDGTTAEELRLVARFAEDAIDRIVAELKLPRWQKERPPITVWIVVDDGFERQLMPVEYSYAWDALQDVARLRGLPIQWPDVDPERDGLIDLQLLWGGFTDALPGHGSRAGGDVIVAARREGPVWNVRWNYGSGEQTEGWRIRERDLSFALIDGLHRLTDLVAARDSIAPSALGDWQVELRVAGLASGRDYERVLTYLQGLGVVDDVTVREASPGQVLFALDLNALPQYLEAELRRGGVLQRGVNGRDYVLVPL